MLRSTLLRFALLVPLTVSAARADDLSPIRTLPFSGSNLMGLAFGAGHLWATDLQSHTIFELDPGNGEVLSTRPDLTGATGLAYDGVHLLATQDAGTGGCGAGNPNRIWRLDPATGAVQSFIPSPITGGGGGLGFMAGGRLFAAGAYDQCNGTDHVEIVEVDPASGVALGHFDVEPYGGLGFSRELDCDASAVLFLTAIPTGDFTAEFHLHRFTPAGALLRMDRLILTAETSGSGLTGLAWGNDEIFVADRDTRTIYVFSYASGPTPARRASWGRIKSLYR